MGRQLNEGDHGPSGDLVGRALPGAWSWSSRGCAGGGQGATRAVCNNRGLAEPGPGVSSGAASCRHLGRSSPSGGPSGAAFTTQLAGRVILRLGSGKSYRARAATVTVAPVLPGAGPGPGSTCGIQPGVAGVWHGGCNTTQHQASRAASPGPLSIPPFISPWLINEGQQLPPAAGLLFFIRLRAGSSIAQPPPIPHLDVTGLGGGDPHRPRSPGTARRLLAVHRGRSPLRAGYGGPGFTPSPACPSAGGAGGRRSPAGRRGPPPAAPPPRKAGR